MTQRFPLHTVSVISLILAVSVFIWGLPATTVGAGPERTKVNIALPVATVSFLPSWVAEYRGYFKEEGFTEIKILTFRGESDVLQAMASGSTDFAISALTGLVQLIKMGHKFKAVWAGYNMAYFEWYAQPKFKSIAETKGGRYAVSTYGALTDVLTRLALRRAGLDPEKDVKILQLGGSAQSLPALEAGQIEASILAAPFSYLAVEKGFVKLMNQKDYIAPDWPLHMVYLKEDYIAKNPNTVRAILRAHGKAINFIKANPEEAASLATKTYKIKREHILKFINEFGDEWHADGRLPQKGLKVFWDISIEGKDIAETEPWPNSRWLDDTFLKTQNQWLK